jgi:hypothetical protein
MRKAIVLLMFLQAVLVLKSQDTLSLKDGRIIPCKIVSKSDTAVFIEENTNGELKQTYISKARIQNIKESLINSQTTVVENENRDSLAKIYIFRPPFSPGTAITMKIFIDNQPIVRLGYNSYYQVELKPGTHKFSSALGDTAVLKLNVEAGNTYYIASYYVTGFWSGIPVLELFPAPNGKSIVEGGYLKPQKFQPIIEKKLNSRIGLVFGGGGGIQNNVLGKTDKNTDLTLSAGGGAFIGLEYGHEYSKNFDLSWNLFYQGSTLSTTIKNGEAAFDRLALLVTPALIIPVKGDYMKFRLGGGLGLYSLGSMSVTGAWINNADVKLNYMPALGYHASVVFDVLLSEKTSYTFGLKYYNVNYQYTEMGSNVKPNNATFSNLNGSGIDFTFGFYFHFAK